MSERVRGSFDPSRTSRDGRPRVIVKLIVHGAACQQVLISEGKEDRAARRFSWFLAVLFFSPTIKAAA
jgi:hypothetical protein